MSTHRRGVRPSQWPVRDLLGPENGRARFWDARVGAAAAGLFACGAAVTVVLSSGSRAVSDQRLEAPGSPLVIPAPALVPPVPAAPPPVALPPVAAPQVAEPQLPARVDAPRPRSARPQHRRAAPRHRTAVPAPSVRNTPAQGDAAPQDRTLAEQVATAIDGWEGGTEVGWLLVPVQRPADAAALLDVACVDEPCQERGSGGRHRARDRDAEQRDDRHHEARGGRHRAPDQHHEERGGRHRAPEHDDQRSTPYRVVMDDRDAQDEADRDERDRAEVRSGHADRHERDRTAHDAAQDREDSSSDDDPPSRDSDAHDSSDERGSGHDDASDDDWDWFSAA